MTRVNKIGFLTGKCGVNIKFHYNYYTKQKRLIIDEIEDFKYINTAEDQLMAGQLIDLLY